MCVSLSVRVPNYACPHNCVCLGNGSCGPRGSPVSPHAAPVGSPCGQPGPARGHRGEFGHEARLVPGRERLPQSSGRRGWILSGPAEARCPRLSRLAVPGCTEPAAPGREDPLLRPGRSEERPSRSQPAASGIQVLKPAGGNGHLPPGAVGLETFGLSFPGYERFGDGAEVWAVF